MLEKSYSYYITINIIKVENKYLLNPVRITEFSKGNIEYLNTSKSLTYNDVNIDKFILLDFTQYLKININLIKGSSTINKALISYRQYKIFFALIYSVKRFSKFPYILVPSFTMTKALGSTSFTILISPGSSYFVTIVVRT